MFTGYYLSTEQNNAIDFSIYEERGRKHLQKQKDTFKTAISEYIINGIADGTKMEKDWFPMIEADIFISHSHIDEKLAHGIAGWLNTQFNLKCFIDSCVWNYSDDLLEMINSEYSDKRETSTGGYLYEHKKCNTASKHVNIMLSVALQKMIDKTEVTILLNTNNAIAKYENVYDKATYSPWIYSEIICTQIVRKKALKEYRIEEPILKHLYENAQSRGGMSGFQAAYEVSIAHLTELNSDMLLQWKKMYEGKRITYPLDYLYEISCPNEMRKLSEYIKG